MSGDEPELEGPKGFRSRVDAYLPPAGWVAPIGWQTVPLSVARFDTLGEFDLATFRFTPRRAGFYLIQGQTYFTNPGAAFMQDMRLNFNGVRDIGAANRYPSVAVWDYLNCMGIAHMTPAEWVSMDIRGSVPPFNPTTFGAAAGETRMVIHRLS
jgi:hypothetical protein